MEESPKGAVPGSSTKNASLDEDFGKDFLNWKPSKFGKGSMDFDIEPVDGKSKKFNFGKLDDFDLGADFGKLPSFKMDMSDLDFSSPVKKIGTKPSNEKSSKESFLAKKGQEKDKFSFTFDFDEFGKFDLDSQVTKEKKNTQAKPTTSSASSDHNNKNKTQSQNSNMDIDTEKAAPKPDTSKSHNSIENNINVTKQISDNLSNASHSSLKVYKEFSLPSLSGNSSSRRLREVFDKTEKEETSVQSIGSSSHSRSERNNSTAVSSANRDEIKEKDAENINILDQNRNSDGEKSLNNVTLASAVNRDVRHVNSSTPTKEKLSASVLYKSQQTSILTTKKNEGLNLLSSDIRRDSKQLDGQTEISKTKLEKPSINGASLGTGNSKVETENKTFSTLRSTTNSLLNNKVLLKDEKQIHVSRLVKLNPRSPTVAPEKDLKSAKFSERNKASLSPQIKTATAPPVPIFSSKEKLVSPSLKRKVAEESASGPFIRNPLKRISSNSPIETRKSPEIVHMSPKTISENEIPEDCNNNLASSNALTLTEMPVFLENNSNVEKAENISKDLDDICSMLKKKQEETKELLVRAVVNNNKLLMLNHPMYDEKNLHALESFAATLRAKHLIS